MMADLTVWTCEQHPGVVFPHDDCIGPGVLLAESLTGLAEDDPVRVGLGVLARDRVMLAVRVVDLEAGIRVIAERLRCAYEEDDMGRRWLHETTDDATVVKCMSEAVDALVALPTERTP